MRAGKLDRTIAIQRSTYTQDATGNPVFDWTNVATLRAELVQVGTEEFMRPFGASDENLIIFKTRYLAGVTTADRVSYLGAFHNIKEVKELGRGDGLEIRAVAAGAS